MSIIKKFVSSILSIYPFTVLGEVVTNCRYIPECRKALIDPDGFGMLALRISYLGIPRKYHHIFYELKEGDVCIDGGANLGIFTDLIISRGGICHSFEPNPVLFQNLQRKYRNNNQVILHQEAISDNNEEVTFHIPETLDADYLSLSEGGTTEKNARSVSEKKWCNKKITSTHFTTKAIKFTDFLQDISSTPIYILKLDIEGSEFSVLEDMIRSGAHKNIRYIFCETHERCFSDGKERLAQIKQLINENSIINIYLDWI